MKNGLIIDSDGVKRWYKNDLLHREDGPAVEGHLGYKKWYKNDKLHRLDGPAIIYSNGDQEWYQNGKRHREDGPAIKYIYIHEGEGWYLHGEFIADNKKSFQNYLIQRNLELVL